MQYLKVMNGKILIEEFQFYVIRSTVNSRNKWGKSNVQGLQTTSSCVWMLIQIPDSNFVLKQYGLPLVSSNPLMFHPVEPFKSHKSSSSSETFHRRGGDFIIHMPASNWNSSLLLLKFIIGK